MKVRMMAMIILMLVSMSCVHQEPKKATFVYETPKTKIESSIRNKLIKSKNFRETTKFISEKLSLNSNLKIVLAKGKSRGFNSSDNGPYYDPNIRSVIIPYQFFDYIKKNLKRDKYSDSKRSLDTLIIDSIIFALLHELSHALFDFMKVPFTGREEDSADALAAYLLLKHHSDGQEILLTAADLFYIEASTRGNIAEPDFWGEHSLDEQRFYLMICWLYGSSPRKYAHVLKAQRVDGKRRALCREEYALLMRNFDKLLSNIIIIPEPN